MRPASLPSRAETALWALGQGAAVHVNAVTDRLELGDLRFIREAVTKPLWEKLAAKLPAHKIYLCMETPAVWEKIDPSVTSGACIEKRLCHTETIPFDYRA